jgi:hypothetical protein
MKGIERRVAERQPADGEVVVDCGGILPRRVSGILVDVSQSGFRMKHREPVMERGDTVHFHFQSREGEARVMWNRSEGGDVETGFCLL